MNQIPFYDNGIKPSLEVYEKTYKLVNLELIRKSQIIFSQYSMGIGLKNESQARKYRNHKEC